MILVNHIIFHNLNKSHVGNLDDIVRLGADDDMMCLEPQEILKKMCGIVCKIV